MQSAVVSPRQSFREFEFPRARDSIPMIGRHRRAADLRTTGSETLLQGEGSGRDRGDSFEFRRTHLRRPTCKSISSKSKTNMPGKEKYCSARSILFSISE